MNKMKTLGAIFFASAIGFNGCGRVGVPEEYSQYSFCGNIGGDSIITYNTFLSPFNLKVKKPNGDEIIYSDFYDNSRHEVNWVEIKEKSDDGNVVKHNIHFQYQDNNRVLELESQKQFNMYLQKISEFKYLELEKKLEQEIKEEQSIEQEKSGTQTETQRLIERFR